jgi:hypothetical protein
MMGIGVSGVSDIVIVMVSYCWCDAFAGPMQ